MSKGRILPIVAVALLSAAGLLLVRGPVDTSAPPPGTLPGPRDRDVRDAVDRPSAGNSPADIPARGWWAVAVRVVEQFNDDRLMYEAGSVVFFVLLAIFPALAAMVSLYGLFANPQSIASHLAMLSSVMPSGSMNILTAELKRLADSASGELSFGLVFGFVVSLWSANQGMKSLFDVLNVAYDEKERRSYVRLTLITLGFTLASLVFTLIVIAGVVVLPAALQFVYLGGETDWLIRVVRWPVLLVIVMFYLSVIYRYGPSRERARWQWVTWGGAFAAIGWLLVSFAFSYYVSRFGSYNRMYGSLGAVIGFMTWIWISVMVVLLGAELNAELERQAARTGTRHAGGAVAALTKPATA